MPQTATAEEITFVDRIQQDPVFFARECLGVDPWERQREILESVRDNPRTAVRSCHGAGKSFIAACAVLWFLFSHRNSIVITTAPTGRQVKKILWAELHQLYNGAPIPLGGRMLDLELKVDDKWFAFGFSTDDGDSFQGPHAEYVLLIVDEASGVSPALEPAFEGVLSSGECRVLRIGNPTDGTGVFAGEFKSPATRKVHISAFDTPNFTKYGITLDDIRSGTWEAKITGLLPYPALVTPAWVADKFRRWGETSPLWQARVMGEFPEQGSDTLIPLAWIEAAQQRELPHGEPNELGVDVARFGSDETSIAHRRGAWARVLLTTAKEDTMQTTGRAIVAKRETGATSIKVDDIGLGGGVTDRLRELRHPVVPINVGGAATDPEDSSDPERFKNKRAELWWSMRVRAQDGDLDIDPLDEELAAQLASIKFKYTSRGQIQIEAKEDMKKRGLPSPDRADSVVLAFAPAATGYSIDALTQH